MSATKADSASAEHEEKRLDLHDVNIDEKYASGNVTQVSAASVALAAAVAAQKPSYGPKECSSSTSSCPLAILSRP